MLDFTAPALPARRDRTELRWLWLGGCALAVLLASLLSLAAGAKSIPMDVVIDSLRGLLDTPDAVIVNQARLPRTLLGLLAGLALGLAGALIQALTRNPLADPGLLGVNAGASFAMVLGVALFSASAPGSLLLLAFGGALACTVLVYLIGAQGAGPQQSARFLLAGVALGAVLMGLASGLTLFDARVFDTIRFWNAGSLDIRDMERLRWMCLPVGIGAVLAAVLAAPLNLLGLGDTLAQALGTRLLWLQAAAVLAITLLCGAATATAGPIGFVGLMIPQLARQLGGADQRWIFAYSALLGPLLLLSADVLGRVLLPGELRVSIVTAFVGAPALIWLARRERVLG